MTEITLWISAVTVSYVLSYFFLALFNNGIINSLSSSGPSRSLLRRQFPLTDGLQKESTIRSACVLWQNSSTFGLSLVPPLWRWQPKNCSIGSWQRLLLSNANFFPFTSGSEKRNSTNPMNDKAKCEECTHCYTSCLMSCVYLLVIRRPSIVWSLSSILFFWTSVNPSRFLTLSSQSLRYVRKSFLSHCVHYHILCTETYQTAFKLTASLKSCEDR